MAQRKSCIKIYNHKCEKRTLFGLFVCLCEGMPFYYVMQNVKLFRILLSFFFVNFLCSRQFAKRESERERESARESRLHKLTGSGGERLRERPSFIFSTCEFFFFLTFGFNLALVIKCFQRISLGFQQFCALGFSFEFIFKNIFCSLF